MSGKDSILVIALEEREAGVLRDELRGKGYQVRGCQPGLDIPRRLGRGTRAPSLIVVSIVTATGSQAGNRPEDISKAGLELCREVRGAIGSSSIPVLFVAPVWARGELADMLETGADYILFAPYSGEQLLLAVRTALLNGHAEESTKHSREEPMQEPVEIIHQDRVYHVTAGRERLARLTFSLFDQLQHATSSLSWSQSETEELRRQLRQEREQAALALQLPEVVQGIAHDFGNLLETIEASATVLRSGPAQPAPYRAAMQSALSQAGTLLEALQNWPAWEKQGAYREPVELATVVSDVLEAALLPMKAPQILVRVRMHDLPPVWTQPALLLRIVSNLVWNAVQAMPAGGTLLIAGQARRGKVGIEISDTGGGIPEENVESAFRLHFSTKEGHTGIGLSLVKDLVQRSGGELSLSARRGGGSTFALSYPTAVAASSHLEAGAESLESRTRQA